jgi:predicted dehydrogenase
MPKSLRGAIVGYGFISAKGHVPAYLERMKTTGDVAIVAIADSCPARREIARKALPPDIRIYDSHESLLAAEARNLDFIDIAAPPYAHAEIAHAALDRGLHVLCEKPIALSTEEARGVLQHARKAQRVFFPCHNYKHAPVIKAVRRVIDSGRIGKVRMVTLATFRNTHAKGVNEWNRDWRRQKKFSGGGIAMDHGSHTFYLAFDWLGAYPTAVTAKMSTLGDFDTEDNFSCSLEFPTGIAQATLTWTAGVRKVIYTIHGEHGAITVEDDDIEVALMQQTSGPDVAQGAVKWSVEKQAIESNWMDASHVTWFNSLIDQFKRAIETGEHVGVEAREAFLCIQLIQTAYASSAASSRELPLATEV